MAALAFGIYDRAEIISAYNTSSGFIKVFFIDFGTTGFVQLKNCKILIEEFGKVSKKAIRGALYGIRPRGNTRLWNLEITVKFIERIKDKIHRIKIVKHHEHVSRISLKASNRVEISDFRRTSTSLFSMTAISRAL